MMGRRKVVLIATNDTPYLAATNLLLINVRNHFPSVSDKLPSETSQKLEPK
jgi:hypothetical protein